MENAAENYDSLGMELHFYSFDRSNTDSFVTQSNEAIRSNPNGVVIAPLLIIESEHICLQLEKKDIPYVFVDSNLSSAAPLAFIGQDTMRSGRLAAKLLNFGFKNGHPAVIIKYADFDRLNKTIEERVEGFKKFYDDQGWDQNMISELEVPKGFNLSKLNASSNVDLHVFVPNSRTHQIVKRINEEGLIHDNRIIGYDSIAQNVAGIASGQIDFIINQNPFKQGMLSIQAFYKYLILNSKVNPVQYMPLEIVTKENLDYSDILN
jgi:LacI family transcriptional regulator